MKFYRLQDYVASFILWVFILIFLVPLFLVLFLWKLVVIGVAKVFYRNLYPTDPNDSYLAIDDTNGIPIVNAAQIWKVKGRLDANEFRQHFYNCFLADEDARRRYGNFYCYLVRFGGHIFKKRVPELDLNQQILERTLDCGTSLEAWITKWFVEERFRPNTPLWQIVLLHLPVSGETIFLYKNHHCLADGYGFIHIVDKLTGNSSPYLVKEEDDSLWDKLKDAFFLPKELAELVIGVARTRDIFYPIKDPDRQWFLGLATMDDMDLNTLKQIRRKTNTRFTTVLMSLMIGALRRLVTEKLREEHIPVNIYTANSLPWPNHPRTTLVNHWSGGVFRVPFRTSDSLERLVQTDNFFKHFHDVHMHKMVKRIMVPVTWCVPSCVMRLGRKLKLYHFRYSNTFASLMLSDQRHYILGHEVENIYLPLGMTDIAPTCVIFSVSTTHSGKLDLSIVANSEIVSTQEDVDRLTKIYFPMELENLRKRVQETNNNEFTTIQCE